MLNNEHFPRNPVQSKGKPVPIAVGGKSLGVAFSREGEWKSNVKVMHGHEPGCRYHALQPAGLRTVSLCLQYPYVRLGDAECKQLLIVIFLSMASSNPIQYIQICCD